MPEHDDSAAEPRPHHDLGGLAAGPIDRAEHAHEPWEKELDAIRVLLGQRGLLTPDELRLGIERLSPEEYARLSYYERWTASLLQAAIRKGLLDPAAFEARVAAIEAERNTASG